METGLKTIQPNNISEFSNYKLSIQVSLNGLCFCILRIDTNTFEYYKTFVFEKKLTPSTIVEKLDAIFNSESILKLAFKSVKVIHNNMLFSLVPKAMFDKTNAIDYLKFNTKPLPNDTILYNYHENNTSYCVYLAFTAVNDYLNTKYKSIENIHYTSLLLQSIQHLKQNNIGHKVYLNIHNNQLDIIALNANQLIFQNVFNYTTKEDFIYYTLFTLEQLNLDPNDVEVVILNAIKKESDEFKILYKYIRNVKIEAITTSFSVAKHIKNKTILNQIITNSF